MLAHVRAALSDFEGGAKLAVAFARGAVSLGGSQCATCGQHESRQTLLGRCHIKEFSHVAACSVPPAGFHLLRLGIIGAVAKWHLGTLVRSSVHLVRVSAKNSAYVCLDARRDVGHATGSKHCQGCTGLAPGKTMAVVLASRTRCSMHAQSPPRRKNEKRQCTWK